MALVDYFLKIDGVPGESTDHKHKDEISVLSFSWSETQPTSGEVGLGRGSGKVQMGEFQFTSQVNKASPLLALKCANGEHIKSAVLVCRRAGKDQQEYFTVKLADILISSYQVGGSQGDVVPTDQFSLNFSKIEWEYKPQGATGALGGPVKAGYNLKEQKQV